MHREVAAISSRLSLRPPQREALEILDRITELAPPGKTVDPAVALAAIQSAYPSVSDFERDFPSLCFALATGVGKTRLMGAFISYLHLVHGINNFFVLAPNLTIYNKLIADFTPGSPKYVFPGIATFATDAPEIITGDNFESRAGTLFDHLIRCKINIFNISKINTEVRGGKSPRIKRLSEYLGESYFEYLANLPDLVLLMDESHRYRASAGIRAINELKPILGLELTATPFVTSGQSTTPFKNVVLDYPLRRAMEDGFVKEPAVVTRQNFRRDGLSDSELERIKLEDGIRLHEQTRVELETYARQHPGEKFVKPFVLVIARDTTHAAELMAWVQSDAFFEGRYRDKVIQVDSSSGSGAERDEIVEKLLKVEEYDSPTEIVIHVNMLKEGWDVTNLYTIVPLRAANVRVLIEQTIGRGLRLPYGRRTGVEAVDRLSIVAHDRFQEIVDEARKENSLFQLKTLVLTDEQLAERPRTVVALSTFEARVGISPSVTTANTEVVTGNVTPIFTTPAEAKVAQFAYDSIARLQRSARVDLQSPEVQQRIVREVEASYNAGQVAMPGFEQSVNFASVVERTAAEAIRLSMEIPRIIVVPQVEQRGGFRPFTLDLHAFRVQPIPEELFLQQLRTGAVQVLEAAGSGIQTEARLEDYIVSPLIDFDDVDYSASAEVLYDLARQAVDHLRSYLPDEWAVEQVLKQNQRALARLIHTQMQPHALETEGELITTVSGGTRPVDTSSYTSTEPLRDYRNAPPNLSDFPRYVFGGFNRCLQTAVKFESNPERLLAIILERDAIKWFRPSTSDIRISYHYEYGEHDYKPDFIAELDDRCVVLETKRRSAMQDGDVLAKQRSAVAWCAAATAFALEQGGKPWSYALIPHDAINESFSLSHILQQFSVAMPAS